MPEQEKNNPSEEQKVLKLFAEQQAMHVEYIDLVQSSSNPEIVILGFIQQYPEPIVPLEQQELNEEQTGRLVARFAFTWPHIARIRDLLNHLLSQRESQPNE